jgi:hypothetical protein
LGRRVNHTLDVMAPPWREKVDFSRIDVAQQEEK